LKAGNNKADDQLLLLGDVGEEKEAQGRGTTAGPDDVGEGCGGIGLKEV